MFRNWVFQNFPFLENDFDALTDYELFCKMIEYVKNLVKDNEEFKKQLEDLENYIYNLNIQEAVNTKLDEMVSDGTLNEIINQNIFNELNDKIDETRDEVVYNKIHQLSDNVQSLKYDEIDFTEIIPEDFSLSSSLIINNKGILVANDWRPVGGSSGEKFNIITFDYTNNVISNVVTQYQLVLGHSNSMCRIDDTHVLIVAISHNYVYDLINNTYNEITLQGYVTMCSDYKNKIYIAISYDHNLQSVVNKMYEISFDENYLPSIVNQYNLENLSDKLDNSSQGMVIYEDLIIFPSYSDSKLCIYDFNTKKYLKSQLFTAPYLPEYEDGFVYNNNLLLCDTLGRLFIPDIYGKNLIGNYSNNTITRSVTDICLYDDVIKLNNENNSITIDFKKYMTFMHNNENNDIGVLGGLLESITIFMVLRNFKGSEGVHNLIPIEIPLYKKISYENDTINWLNYVWSSYYITYNNDNSQYERHSICGKYAFGGGDSIPNITINIDPYMLVENFNLDGTQNIDIETNPDNGYEIYITKIIGHRKVGFKY